MKKLIVILGMVTLVVMAIMTCKYYFMDVRPVLWINANYREVLAVGNVPFSIWQRNAMIKIFVSLFLEGIGFVSLSNMIGE